MTILSPLREVFQLMPNSQKLSSRNNKPLFLSEILTCALNKPQNPPLVHVFLVITHQISFFQKDLWSRGIERSDELLHIVKNDCLLFQNWITSLVATSCLMAQCKTYGKCTCVKDIQCKWYSRAEMATLREIVIPSLSVPEQGLHQMYYWFIVEIIVE